MKTPYSLYTIEQLERVFARKETFLDQKDRIWKPLFPVRYWSKWNDLKLAWLVFTRKAEAVLRNDL